MCDFIGIDCTIQHIENPRTESENHYFNPKHDKLAQLGYKPNWDIEDEIAGIIKAIMPYKDRINKDVILPKTKWNSA